MNPFAFGSVVWIVVAAFVALFLPSVMRTKEPPTLDDQDSQHIHDMGVPRLGGVIVLCIMWAALLSQQAAVLPEIKLLLACATPAFVVGLLEDVLHSTSPWTRYAGCIASSFILVAIIGPIPRFDIGFLDVILTSGIAATLVSVFCIAGVTQAFNIVDGKNGLSSGMALIALFGLTITGWSIGDEVLAKSISLMAMPVLGFWCVNIIRGRLFLGDSGAYLLGFIVAACGLLTTIRNPTLSPWLPVVLAAYPIVETLFTFLRRVVIEQKRFSDPDFLHMHSLIYDRLIRAHSGSSTRRRKLGNSLSALILLAGSMGIAAIALNFLGSSLALQWLFLGYVVCYLSAYRGVRRLQRAEPLTAAQVDQAKAATDKR